MQNAEHHRERFELAYATEWAKAREGNETPEQLASEVKTYREGDTYEAGFPRLRFGWEGYQWALAGRSCLAQIQEPAQPVLYVSPEQLENHSNPEGPEGAEAGHYLPARKTPAGKFTQPLYAGAAPAAVAGPTHEDRAAWFALAMGAAASLEDAANCLRDEDAKNAAMGAATHVRESCNKLWWAAPALEAPQGKYPPLPKVGAIGYASIVDVDRYEKSMSIGPHLPGVRDVALWTTDQMRAYFDLGRHPSTDAPALEAPAAPAYRAEMGIAGRDYLQRTLGYDPDLPFAWADLYAAMLAAAPQAPAAPVESKTYSDGTTATGPGILPGMSPNQQVLCTLLDTVEEMLGGANGPTIQIRAALLAAPAAPGAPAVDAMAPDLRTLAEAAEGNGQHIYTNPRDSNKWRENEAWHRAASPCAVLHLLDRIAELEARKPLPPTEAEANALWADCLRKHKRPGPFELIQEFCAAGQSGATAAEARNPLIARREVVADGPVRVTRLHLSTEGRAALTTTATGPLPGITGGSS